MIGQELRQLKTAPRDLRKFGLTVGGVFLLLSAWCAWRHKVAWPWLVVAGGPLFLLGLVAPKVLRWVYLAWMALALALGWIVSTVLLTVFFYLVVTPVGLMARACGQDFLRRRWDSAARSYWLPRDRPRPPSTSELEQQF